LIEFARLLADFFLTRIGNRALRVPNGVRLLQVGECLHPPPRPPLAKSLIGLHYPNIWGAAEGPLDGSTGSQPVDKSGAIPDYPADD